MVLGPTKLWPTAISITQSRRVKRLVPYMRAFMRKVRVAEGVLSPAQICNGSSSEMNSWNRVQHELYLARQAADLSAQRTARMAAWAQIQKQVCAEHAHLCSRSGNAGLSPVQAFRPFCA